MKLIKIDDIDTEVNSEERGKHIKIQSRRKFNKQNQQYYM